MNRIAEMNRSGSTHESATASPFSADGGAFVFAASFVSRFGRLASGRTRVVASDASGPESMGLRREPVFPWTHAPARIYTAAAVLALGSMLLLA